MRTCPTVRAFPTHLPMFEQRGRASGGARTRPVSPGRGPGRAHAPLRALGARAAAAWLWLVALALAVPSTVALVRLYRNLTSEIEELLPRNAASVSAVDELRQRLPGLSTLGVVVATSSAVRAARRRAADRRSGGARARATRRRWCARSRPAPRRPPSGASWPPTCPCSSTLDDLVEVRARRGGAPELGHAQPPRRSRSTRRSRRRSTSRTSRRSTRRGSPASGCRPRRRHAETRPSGPGTRTSAGTTTMLLIEGTRVVAGRAPAPPAARARARRTSQALGGPTHYAPGLRVGFAGNIAVSVEELSALSADPRQVVGPRRARGAGGDPAVLPLVGGAAAAVHAARGRDGDLVRRW